MENGNKIKEVIFTLNELKADSTVNKNIKGKIEKIIAFLEQDVSLGIDKALLEIEEMMENNNLPSYTRTQIWNVVSLLESNKLFLFNYNFRLYQ